MNPYDMTQTIRTDSGYNETPQTWQGHGGVTIRVVKFLIQESGTYNLQYRRPYEAHADPQLLNTLAERIDPLNVITPNSLAGLASQFVTPSATAREQLDIPNGWGERRSRFMLELDIFDPMVGGHRREYVLGYTDHSGMSLSGYLDPNLRFYVNSVIQAKQYEFNTPYGQRSNFMVNETSHILMNENFQGAASTEQQFRMRPSDVYTSLSRISVPDNIVNDARTINTHIPVKADRANNLAARYASNIMEGFRKASLQQDLGARPEDVYTSARDILPEGSITQDAFLSKIAEYNGGIPTKTFTMAQVLRLDPSASEAGKVIPMRLGDIKMDAHAAGQTSHWDGSDRLTQCATILAQSVSSMMMELGMTDAVFNSNNDTFNAQPVTVFAFSKGMVEEDMGQKVLTFISRFEHQIMRDLTWNYGIRYKVEIVANLFFETRIGLSLDGGPMIWYTVPTFADALMSPMVTNIRQGSTDLAQHFSMVLDSVVDVDRARNNGGINQVKSAAPIYGNGYTSPV